MWSITAGRKKGFLILVLFICYCCGLISQNEYSARLYLADVDTTAGIACYDLQISNGGLELWRLANYNISLFYDASAACYRSDSLIQPGFIFRSEVRDNIIGSGLVSGTGLSYEDSLGVLRLGLSFVDEGVGIDIDTSGTWYSTIQICFDLKFSDISSPETCLSVNFSTAQIQNILGTFPDIVQEWNDDNTISSVSANQLFDVVPEANRNSCFVLDEFSGGLCFDGLDNDEDGLIDCMDSDCGPGPISFQVDSITCFRPEGIITAFVLDPEEGIEYSIDGGMSLSTDSSFVDLGPGAYDLVVVKNKLFECSFNQRIELFEPDCSESGPLACSDGIDNDGNGLIDCEDANCSPLITGVSFTEPTLCPNLTDGQIIIEAVGPELEYSIDSGLTFINSSIFSNLPTGNYFPAVLNLSSGCIIHFDQSPITLTDQQADCKVLPDFYLPNIVSLNSQGNDLLSVHSPQVLNIVSFEVFDRWGNMVHSEKNTSSVDSDHGWRGLVNQNEVSVGVFVYFLQYQNGQQIMTHAGNVTVVD